MRETVGERGRFAAFLAADGVVERCELRSAVGFFALHGGLEKGTAELAAEAARRCGASLYTVVQPETLHHHVPSHCCRPEESDRFAAFCAHVDVAVSLHGYGGIRDSDQRWTTIAVGGVDRELAVELATRLRAGLFDYEVVDDLDDIPPAYRGVHPANPVNRLRRGGVQLELPPRVRGHSPVWARHDFEREPFVPHGEALLTVLSAWAAQFAAA